MSWDSPPDKVRKSLLRYDELRPPVDWIRNGFRVGTPLAVPELQALAAAHRPGPGQAQAQQWPDDFAGRMGPQLSPRGGYVLPQDDEPALPSERPAHHGLFHAVEFLIEAAGRVERFAGAEEKAAAGQPQHPVSGDRQGRHDAAVQR